MSNIYYMIDNKDQEIFEEILNSVVDVNYKRFDNWKTILCQEKAEELVGYRLLDISEDELRTFDEKIEDITGLKDLVDVMDNYTTSSKDFSEFTEKTFTQIYKIWRKQ